MRLKTTLGAVAIGMGASLALAAPASAANIYISNASLTNYENGLNLSLNGGPNEDAAAGQFAFTANYGTSYSTPTFTIYAWCMDIPNQIGLGGVSVPYTSGSPTSAPIDNKVADSIPLSFSQIAEITDLAAYGNMLLANAATPNKGLVAGAIQVAIWETEYGNSLAIADGGSADSAATVKAQAASYITDAPNYYASNPPAPQATALSDAINGVYQAQGQLFITGSIPPQQVTVAEPASLAALGAGLFGIGMVRRRRA